MGAKVSCRPNRSFGADRRALLARHSSCAYAVCRGLSPSRSDWDYADQNGDQAPELGWRGKHRWVKLIATLSSTKNDSGERDPEMHQTNKGNQRHFGMKVHIVVDADSGLVHTVTAVAAHEHDVTRRMLS
jgi:IS5 family transposase